MSDERETAAKALAEHISLWGEPQRYDYIGGTDFWHHLPKAVLDDKQSVLTLAAADGASALHLCSARLKADRDTVLRIVKLDGSALEAAGAYQHDPEIVLAAVHQFGPSIHYAAPALQANEQVQSAARENAERLGLDKEDVTPKAQVAAPGYEGRIVPSTGKGRG